MAEAELAFPVIDFAPFASPARTPADAAARAACVARIDAVARHSGAFYLANHGVDEGLIARLLELDRRFYALPAPERTKILAPSGMSGGYQPRDHFNEAFFASVIREHTPGVDYSAFGANQWPASLPSLEPTAMEFTEQMNALGERLLGAIALGLGVDEHHFAPLFGAGALQTLQLRYYAPERAGANLLGPHYDLPPLSFIVQDERGGLEGLCDGKWAPVPPLPGTIVCQIGEAMLRWTNDRFVANLHQVIHQPGHARYSLVYCLAPRLDASMACLPACCDDEHPPRYEPMSFAEFVAEYVAAQAAKGKQ